MPTIGDMIDNEPAQADAGALAPAAAAEAQAETGGIGLDFSFLLKETGPGPIEDYLEHPLNAKRSRGLAQALRGATGLFGEGLRAALADILFGGMEYMRERRLEAAAHADPVSRQA